MAFDINDWARYVKWQRRFTANHSFYNEPQVTHRVSKSFKGGYRQDRNVTYCKDPLTSSHLHFPGSFSCNSLQSGECDSKFSREHVNGEMKSGYHATFGHDETSTDPRDLHKERGYFFGGFRLLRDDNWVVKGIMDGNCNIGLVRKPLRDPVEECHHTGRWYGRIQATVRLPQKEKAFLTANISLDVTYKPTPSFLETEFVGVIEGMLIRKCKKAAK